MSLATITIITFSILFFSYHVSAFNILAIVSVPLGSHYTAFHNLFSELATRGHFVTVINNFPHEQSSNLRFVNLQRDTVHQVPSLEQFEAFTPSLLHIRNFMIHMDGSKRSIKLDCETLLNNSNARSHLAERVKYDVIFVEQFVSDCALVYAATHFDAPIIGISSHVMLPWNYPRLGIPFDMAADPFYFSNAGPNPSLLSKLETALMRVIINTLGKWNIQGDLYDVFGKRFPNVSLDIEQIAKRRIKMSFVYQHHSITGARLLAPQTLEIAGIHIKKPKPVAKDIEDFLAGANHGAIYIGLGTNLIMSSMSPRMLKNFLQAFRDIPQKVLMKWENDTFPSGYDNVLTKKWFPQLDVLCHPKVVAFVSHGGMLSSSEAAHCGKPMLTMPFFGDQFSNAAALRAVGLGKTLLLPSITAENLASTIKEITSPEMQQNAQKVSRLWHDRPQPVMDSAIYWTEYVARHGHDAPPSLPTTKTAWFEALQLDVITVLSLFLFVIIWIVYVICKVIKSIIVGIFGVLFCKRKQKTQ